MATEFLDEEIDPAAKYLTRAERVAPVNTKVPVNVNADIENINPNLKERIAAMNADWMANKELNPKGIPLPITSGRRTREQQAAEYKARMSGSKTTGFMAVNPDKYPGREYFHEDAVDILPGILPDEYLNKFGLHRPYGAKDPVHVQINPKAPWAKVDQDITMPDGEDIDPSAMYLKTQGVVTAPASVVAPEVKGQLAGVKQEMQNQYANVRKELGAVKNTLSNPDYYTNQLPKQTAALADTLIGGVGGAINFIGTPIAKLFEDTSSKAKPRTEAGKAIFGDDRSITPRDIVNYTTQLFDKPIGKAFGITNDPMYNAEASQKLMTYISQNMDKGADAISKETGMPKADVEWFMNAALIKGVPMAADLTKKGVKAAGELTSKAGQQVSTQFQNVKQKLPGMGEENNPSLRGVGAAEADKGRVRQARAHELLDPIDLSRDQYTRNFKDVNYAREKAKDAATGEPIREHYATQNKKLINNLQLEIEQTGAQKTGIDRSILGEEFNNVINNYKEQRRQQKNDAYTAADVAGETLQQVPYKPMLDYINNIKTKRPTQYDQNPILKIVEEDLRANDPGNAGTINLRQMEDIRALINKETEYGTSNGHHGGEIRKQIDAVTKDAGGTLYQEARALNARFMKEFEENPGIRDILAIKKGTTERKIPIETVVEDSMLKGPRSRVEEIFKTLEQAGPEGQAMISELRGVVGEHIAQAATKGVGRDIHGNPVVNARALNDVITKLDKSGKLDLIFGKKGAERYRTLNDVAIDVKTVPEGSVNYSGSAAQFRNLAAQIATDTAASALAGVPAPITTVGNIIYKNRKAKQELTKVNEFLNYGKDKQ
jgi:hypothetical protein